MAASPEVAMRINGLLKSISADVDSVQRLARSWATMSDHEGFVWDVEWTESMDRLNDLDRDCQAGSMTPKQETRYRRLLGRPKLPLPTLRRRYLAIPTVPLDDVEAA